MLRVLDDDHVVWTHPVSKNNFYAIYANDTVKAALFDTKDSIWPDPAICNMLKKLPLDLRIEYLSFAPISVSPLECVDVEFQSYSSMPNIIFDKSIWHCLEFLGIYGLQPENKVSNKVSHKVNNKVSDKVSEVNSEVNKEERSKVKNELVKEVDLGYSFIFIFTLLCHRFGEDHVVFRKVEQFSPEKHFLAIVEHRKPKTPKCKVFTTFAVYNNQLIAHPLLPEGVQSISRLSAYFRVTTIVEIHVPNMARY
jgi:hypothetical protein